MYISAVSLRATLLFATFAILGCRESPRIAEVSEPSTVETVTAATAPAVTPTPTTSSDQVTAAGVVEPPAKPIELSGQRRISITPLRTDFGTIYGAEARDEETGVLLSRAKQVAVDDNVLVVEETQFSSDGGVIYRGKLFFDAGNYLIREERIEGTKRWDLFQTWISDMPGM
jgi:hypothetical protein